MDRISAVSSNIVFKGKELHQRETSHFSFDKTKTERKKYQLEWKEYGSTIIS